jgi:hypothetical protein
MSVHIVIYSNVFIVSFVVLYKFMLCDVFAYFNCIYIFMFDGCGLETCNASCTDTDVCDLILVIVKKRHTFSGDNIIENTPCFNQYLCCCFVMK